jgi:hypothetical protein
MRAIWKVTSSKLLTKQTTRKNLLYAKNTYILKLLQNLVTAGIEAFVVSGNRFWYACVKEVCCLWTQPRSDIFHQLFIIVEALWSQPVLLVGIQAVVTRSEIRAVRRVVKHLPDEMLQQCSSASSYLWMHIVMEEHCTKCQNSTPFVLNCPTCLF